MNNNSEDNSTFTSVYYLSQSWFENSSSDSNWIYNYKY